MMILLQPKLETDPSDLAMMRLFVDIKQQPIVKELVPFV
jgi:hypothetical protein